MFIINHKKIFISISIVLVVAAVVFISVFGINIGIDFKGGTLTEVAYTEARPDQAALNTELQGLGLGSILLQPTGEAGYLVKSRVLSEEEHSLLLDALSQGGEYSLTETNFNSIGPSVGRELSRKAAIAIILVSLAIVCFIAFAFRKVSKPVSSWKYGIIAVVALLHDVLLPIGLFVLLSRFYGVEADSLIVVAALTILGLSVSDTIVIFDRIRENLRENEEKKTNLPFKEVVGRSLSQSYVRSLSTSLTVILVLLSLFFFGPSTTKYFALMLMAGMFFGTYSSIFLASPLLVLWEEKQKKK